MKLKEFLSDIDNNEITEKLILLDKSMMELHQNGFFVVSDLADIDVIDNEITLASFKNKIDYLNSGYNTKGDKRDILEMCAIGICAYNKFSTFYTSKEFISYIIDNLEMYFENGRVPKIMQEYYIDVLARGNVDYLNNYLAKHEDLASGNNNNKSRVYTKSTAVGRAFSERENSAFTNVLLLPAIVFLIFIVFLVCYMIFYH